MEMLERTLVDAELLECRSVRFTGGDPLLGSSLIIQGLQLAEQKIPNLELLSNLTSMTGEQAAALSQVSNLTVLFPMFGHDRETFGSITGRGELFGCFRHNLGLLKENGTRMIGLVLGRSEQEAAAATGLLDDLGITACRHTPIPVSGRRTSDFGQHHQIREPAFGQTDVLSFYRNQVLNTCLGDRVVVDVNGDITLCHHEPGFTIGNVQQERLKDLLRTGRHFELWQLTKDKLEGCRCCEYRYACRYDCPVAAKACHGHITAKYPFCSYDPSTGTWQS
jgi:radical SAM protein with 4Fe4S-binding SPASM domain